MNAQHFTTAEYREWSDDMSPRLVTMMDVLRFTNAILRFATTREDKFVGLFPWLKNDEWDNISE